MTPAIGPITPLSTIEEKSIADNTKDGLMAARGGSVDEMRHSGITSFVSSFTVLTTNMLHTTLHLLIVDCNIGSAMQKIIT